jgi:hypothetical protein
VKKKVGEILVGEMQVGEKTWSVKLKVGEILGHPFFHMIVTEWPDPLIYRTPEIHLRQKIFGIRQVCMQNTI